MKFLAGTGHYEVVIPVIVHLKLFLIRPVQYEGIFEVKAERHPGEEEETFVRLFYTQDCTGVPRHIVVRKNSKVELLYAYAKVLWLEEFGEVNITVKEPALKVIIDGKEGWVKEAEDLIALGLPEVG